jgi:hypothetical protein
MPGARKNFFGLEGFVWFIGVVEDRIDPEGMGRVRVRCFGWHTEDKELLPTEVLPWAHPVHPVNAPAIYAPKEGDMVFGFFLDGDSAQNPVVFGVFPGKPQEKPDYSLGFTDPRTDFASTPTKEAYPIEKFLKEPTTSRLGRGDSSNTIVQTIKDNIKKGVKVARGGDSWDQPEPSYKAVYPYNYAHETESGHAFELDDTPKAERIHLAHKTGSHIEFTSTGDRVEKVIKDNYTVILGSDYVSIDGACSITVKGDCNLKVSGDFNVEAKEITMKASDKIQMIGSKGVLISSGKDMDLAAGGDFKAGCGKKTSIVGGDEATVQAKEVNLAASKVNIQSGSADPPEAADI